MEYQIPLLEYGPLFGGEMLDPLMPDVPFSGHRTLKG